VPSRSPITLLNVAQNGQVTIPAAFRKEHALAKGGRLMAVRMGDALVMVPHDGILDAICMRFEEALRGSGASIDEIKAQALEERAEIVRKRYGNLLRGSRTKRRK
jgi:bifunctional DNA-binding transcriptional regulator/antitoxin component of YhaV-PrlF toxin-antitoxin module